LTLTGSHRHESTAHFQIAPDAALAFRWKLAVALPSLPPGRAAPAKRNSFSGPAAQENARQPLFDARLFAFESGVKHLGDSGESTLSP